LQIVKTKKPSVRSKLLLYSFLFTLAFISGRQFSFYGEHANSKQARPQVESESRDISTKSSSPESEYFFSDSQEPTRVHAYLSTVEENALKIFLSNISTKTLTIKSIVLNDHLISITPILLPKLVPGEAHSFTPHTIRIAEPILITDITGLVLNYTIQNSNDRLIASDVSLFDMSLREGDLPGFHAKGIVALDDYNFIEIEEQSIRVIPGEWTINKPIVIPSGYLLALSEGTTINLGANASIISFSPLQLNGTQKSPITINCGSSQSGLAVIQAKESSTIRHAVFNHCSSPAIGLWSLTGAVTFYESPVKIFSSKFFDNRSEDSLNIVRSTFEFINSEIDTTTSDAFDGDFVNGKIVNSKFSNCGNDCLDFSGSTIGISHSQMVVAGDKGISIGEKSRAIIEQLSLKKTNIAIASKDSSIIHGKNIDIKTSNIALTVYQKKSEFGAASIYINELNISNTITDSIIEQDSNLYIDGVKSSNYRKDVYQLLEKYSNN
jgi:hypothetical protein